jgi:anti-anti-sigma factor
MPAGRSAHPPALRVTTTVRESGVVLIAVAGEVDLSTAPALPEVLASALAEHRPRLIELDLGEVPFMDSSGINLLVRGRRLAGQAGCEVTISRIQTAVHRVLAIFGLVDVFCPDVRPEDGTVGEASDHDTGGSVA